MGAVLTIAKREIKSGLFSPKSAIIFFFYIVFIGFFFYTFTSSFIEMQSRAPSMGGQAPTLEQLFTALLYNAHFLFIFIIPALTMGTFAEEKRSQTIRLLQTAPITATQIVLGKYLGSLAVMVCLLIASAAYPLFLIQYGNPDLGVILSSYLGLLLLVSAYLSACLWISSLTKNQFVALIFSIMLIFLLMLINWLAPNLSGSDFMQSTLKYLASTEHLDVFLKGMITVGDVAYFLVFTGLFLFFTNIVIDSERWR
jgi:ABC-2 type transport system permease protein